jgi:GNAT superfamily N-acetyltransferase
VRIARVAESDLPELLPLMRAYCDFYRVSPPDDSLVSLSHALIADPEREGVQLLARDEAGRAVGFASVYWSWDTLVAGRVGILHDLFVIADVRGGGIGRALIAAALAECRQRGAVKLGWQTARDNHRARRLYEHVGARRDEWIDYWLPAGSAAAEE